MNKNIATDPIAMIESTRKRERSSAGATLSSDAAERAAALPDEFVPPDESVDASDDAVVNASACEAVLAFAADSAPFVAEVLLAFPAARVSATDAALADVVEVADAFVDADASAAARDAATAFADAAAAFPREFDDAIAAACEAAAAFAVPTVEPAAFVAEVLFAFAAATAEPTAEEVDEPDASVEEDAIAAACEAATAFVVPAADADEGPSPFASPAPADEAAAASAPEDAAASVDEDAIAAACDAAAAFAVPTVEPAAFVEEVLFAFAAATAEPTA